MPSQHTQSARPKSRSRRLPRCVPALSLAAIALAVFAACDTPGVTLVDPDVAGDKDRSLTITVRLEDPVLAQALGWSQGVPDAKVFLMRVGEEFDPITLVTDSTGTAVLESILPGQYRMAAHRMLREDETGPTGGVVRAFGDGRIGQVGSPSVISLTLLANQASPVVFSEIQFSGRYDGNPALGPDYTWFQYFELYNNSDSTIYLDGMLWGWAWHFAFESQRHPCAVTEPFRADPLGLWAAYFHRFPGSGNDYPLAPGQTVVVALDAADHSTVHPNLPDLSHADFELEGTADVDNPDVPNLPEVGPTYFPYSHGVQPSSSAPLFLAQPLDLSTLVQQRDPDWGRDWVRIPTEAVLDVVNADGMSPDYDLLIAPPCALFVPRSMDRLAGVRKLNSYDATFTMQRKTLQIIDGRFVLQDVNTSFVDFTEAQRSPGRIEY